MSIIFPQQRKSESRTSSSSSNKISLQIKYHLKYCYMYLRLRKRIAQRFIKIRYITCGCIILKASASLHFLPQGYFKEKVTHSIRLLLMTLYRYHSLAVYRKNVHDMKSHNIQEITFSCHTKSFSMLVPCSIVG